MNRLVEFSRKLVSVAVFISLICVNAHGSGVIKRNIADLTGLAEHIIHGKVETVTDGLDGSLPYTEVTIRITKTIKGAAGDTYTFRQFGLLEPRDMGNGYTNVNLTPDGWPKFTLGEEVILFIYEAASMTGLRTTVGLFQGKFNVVEGRVANAINNRGLFANLQFKSNLLTKAEEKIVQQSKGPIPVDVFLSIIEKAVTHNLFLGGEEKR